MDKKVLKNYITEALKKKKEEPKEVTGTGGGYGYTTKAFSMWSDDEKAKSEYKRPKVEEVSEEEYCDACDRDKSQCVCPKKVEAKEMTSTSSTGVYDANSFQDINMKGNTKTGQGRSWNKTQIPGGTFVSVKEKCKTFPYCNQGDINALDIKKPRRKRKKKNLQEAIENVSKKTGMSEEEIKLILLNLIANNS
jgi:hypothetical protein